MNIRQHCLQLTQQFAQAFQQSQQQVMLDEAKLENLNQQLEDLLTALQQDQDYHFLGQDLISHLFEMHPNIAHIIPRDLLWFVGGPCLHYLNDDELALYRQLDELCHQAEESGNEFDWKQQKSTLTGSH